MTGQMLLLKKQTIKQNTKEQKHIKEEDRKKTFLHLSNYQRIYNKMTDDCDLWQVFLHIRSYNHQTTDHNKVSRAGNFNKVTIQLAVCLML